MIGILDIVLILMIWFLLTADLSLANILIGVIVAILMPGKHFDSAELRDWLHVLWEIAIAIPQAYVEAIEMIFRPHLYEVVSMERVKPNRTPGLIFLDIFLITFTPKTIVLHYHEDGWYEVHKVQRKKPKIQSSTIGE